MPIALRDLLTELVLFDHSLFVRINSEWTSEFADWLFPLVTDLHKNWIFVTVMIIAGGVWIWRERAFAAKWVLAIIASVSLSDMIAYRVVKANIDRERPPASGVPCVVRGVTNTGHSFPSNHSSNMFAAAMTVAGVSGPASLPFFAAAVLIAYSRVYVGAHFPLDVTGGAVLGIIIAILVRSVFGRWLKRESINSV